MGDGLFASGLNMLQLCKPVAAVVCLSPWKESLRMNPILQDEVEKRGMERECESREEGGMEEERDGVQSYKNHLGFLLATQCYLDV